MTMILLTYFKKWKVHSLKENWTESYLCGHFAIVYPAQSGKVRGLGTVETMIEASVVAIRKGDHELSSFLSNLETEKDTGGRLLFEKDEWQWTELETFGFQKASKQKKHC